MTLTYPQFLVNYKLYEGTTGAEGLELARTVESVAAETGGRFAVAPQTPDLRLVADHTDLPVVAQSATPVAGGRGNGQVSLEAVAAAGADAVLVNHPESRATVDDLARTIERCVALDLESIVCVGSRELGEAVATLEPGCLLFEKPDHVATDRPITATQPELLEEFVATVADVSPETSVLVGGGISGADDVERALELGADAAGAASAVVGAEDRRAWLTDVGEVLARYR